MSLDRMSMGAAAAGVAMLAASVALGVSAWPGVALLVLAAAAASAQAALDQLNEGVVPEEALGLANRISQIEHRLQTVTAKHDELAADMEALKRRAALNSL